MSVSISNSWWEMRIGVPKEIEESLIWKLEQLNILSFAFESSSNESHQILRVWLPKDEWPKRKRAELEKSLFDLALVFLIELKAPKWEEIADEDWGISWKKNWLPDPIGNSLLILPAWLDIPISFINRTVIRLDPGYAFGSGSHPSTRLCLEALEKKQLKNLRVADIGCGSGILSITAIQLGAKVLFAVDTDPLAIRSTDANAKLNHCGKNSLKIIQGSMESLKLVLGNEPVDLLICNILLPVIKELAPSFKDSVRHDGKILLSGILNDQLLELSAYMESLGWEVLEVYENETWALVELGRNS